MVRQKNRYMVIQINEMGKDDTSPLKIKRMVLQDTIADMVQQLHGDFGAAAIREGFITKYCNEHTRVAVIRARRGPHKLVTSSLPCMKTVGDVRINVIILYIGASIKQCFRFIKNYQQRKFNEYCANLKTDEEKIALREAMLTFKSLDG